MHRENHPREKGPRQTCQYLCFRERRAHVSEERQKKEWLGKRMRPDKKGE